MWLRPSATTRSAARWSSSDLGGAVLGRIAVLAQHGVGALVGAVADVPVARCPRWSPAPRRPGRARLIWWANIFSAIGERQMLPEQTKVTCSSRAQTPSTSRRSSTVATCGGRAAATSGSREVVARRSPSRPRRCRCRARRRPRRRGRGRRPSPPDPAAGSAGPARAPPRRPCWIATPSTLAPAITSKWPVEAEVLEDPPRRRLGLRGGHRQPHPGGAQVGRAAAGCRRTGCSSTSRGWCSRRGRRRSPRRRGRRDPCRCRVRCIGGPTIRPARSPSGTSAPDRRPARGGSWPRCRRRSRSGCRRDRRSPTAGGCRRPCVSRIHCSRWPSVPPDACRSGSRTTVA